MTSRSASFACAVLLAASGAAWADRSGLPRPPAEYFGDHAACALILTRDRHDEFFLELGPEQCRMPQAPCSTFKIPNALISLEEGVASGAGHVRRWDGVQRERAATNRDHDLASAMANSVVWYFQAMAREVGEQRMQAWLDRLDYGNRDISAGIDQFWLGSTLKVDAYRQLELLKSLKHGTLPFRPEVQRLVRDILVQDSPLDGTLHGKTGSCRGSEGEPDHGWFIGWIDWSRGTPANPATTWFVFNIRGEAAWGWHARTMALELLNDLP